MSYRDRRAVAFRVVGSAMIRGQRSPGFKQFVLEDGSELFAGGDDTSVAECMAYAKTLGVDCTHMMGEISGNTSKQTD